MQEVFVIAKFEFVNDSVTVSMKPGLVWCDYL